MLLGAAGKLPLAGRRLLDVGCGTGGWLSTVQGWGAARDDLAGIDLIAARATEAARRLPGADVRHGDATQLQWGDGCFEVVSQSMMFSSILDGAVRHAAAAEMDRVLAPGGMVLWYDFFVRNPRNPHVRGIRRREIARLFPGFDLHLRRATLAPPLARVVVPRSWTLGALLTAARVLDTHYVGALRKP